MKTKYWRIAPDEICRDANGFWRHPDFPDFGGDSQALMAWKADHWLNTCRVDFEHDASPELVMQWLEQSTPGCSDWEPSKPEGDGWFILSIFNSETGPACLWGRWGESGPGETKPVEYEVKDPLNRKTMHQLAATINWLGGSTPPTMRQCYAQQRQLVCELINAAINERYSHAFTRTCLWKLQEQRDELMTVLEEITSFAELAMIQANKDGAEWDIGRDLGSARSVIAKVKNEALGREPAEIEGWQFVPIEPTPAMLAAGMEKSGMIARYKAMLANAPKQQGGAV